MKLNKIFKATAFFSTFLLIIFLSIINQKEYTKLRILIWNTPSLTLGNYLAISTGAGFIFSYIITTSLIKIIPSTQKQELPFKDEKDNENVEANINPQYDYTLIERDLKDPAPTMNANFRIIGRTRSTNSDFISNSSIQHDETTHFEEQYDEVSNKDEPIYKNESISNDWNDESFSTW